jgi:hypothetical protein
MVIAFFELREIGIFEHCRLRMKVGLELEGGVRRSIISYHPFEVESLEQKLTCTERREPSS